MSREAFLILALLACLATAAIPVPVERYSHALGLVEKLYLYPDRLDEQRLFGYAVSGLADDLPWLMIEREGATVSLFHGDGTPLGQVTVESMRRLPHALAEVEQRVRDSKHPLGDTDARLSLLNGLAWGLDSYTRVLSGDRLRRFKVRLKGVTVGVGAGLTRRDDALLITSMAADGPAALGGLLEGDIVLRIDGRPTVNMPSREATALLEGDDGTQVSVRVLRDGEEREYVLTRASVVVPNVEHRVLEDDIGYVRITHVSQRTSENLRKALALLRDAGALSTGLVLDLRGNTGGSMKEAAYSADAFLTEGLLLRTVGPDGGRVPNLQARMEATATDDEPDVPIVVVVDDRTASGSEILAGALLEHGRAALVGTRTYGKGTVQKTYTLDDDAQLKLTVAQYILANGREIAGQGIVPDVVLGAVRLEASGMRLAGYDEGWLRTPFEDVLPWIQEARGWRGLVPEDRDLPLEIARRAVKASTGPSRDETLAALRGVAAQVRAAEEDHLLQALAPRQVDWSPAPEDGTFMEVKVSVAASPSADRTDAVDIVVDLESNDSEPIHQALVELESSHAIWDGVVLPIGRIEPGQALQRSTQLPLPPGIAPREDLVSVRLRADKRPPLLIGEEVLRVASTPEPRLQLSARLVPHVEDQHRAEITLTNTASHAISGVQVAFEYPGDLDVELVDHVAQTNLIPARDSQRFDLALRLGDDPPDPLPLTIEVASERYEQLLEWDVALPVDGTEIEREAPLVTWRGGPPTAAPIGALAVPLRITDEHGLADVMVYVNGTKVAWAGGGSRKLDIDTTAELHGRSNRIVVYATDDHGIQTKQAFVVRGEAEATVDAD